MTRVLSILLKYFVVCAGAYVLMYMGELAATGIRPVPSSVNAFLILAGLGGLLAILSPVPERARLRW
jgi:hypothetical protein